MSKLIIIFKEEVSSPDWLNLSKGEIVYTNDLTEYFMTAFHINMKRVEILKNNRFDSEFIIDTDDFDKGIIDSAVSKGIIELKEKYTEMYKLIFENGITLKLSKEDYENNLASNAHGQGIAIGYYTILKNNLGFHNKYNYNYNIYVPDNLYRIEKNLETVKEDKKEKLEELGEPLGLKSTSLTIEKEFNRFKEDYKKVCEEVEKLKKQNKNLSDDLSDMNRDYSEVVDDKDYWQCESADMETEICRLESDISNINRENEDLQVEIDGLIHEVDGLKTSLSRTENDLELAKDLYSKSTIENSVLSEKLDRLEKIEMDYIDENISLKIKVKELESKESIDIKKVVSISAGVGLVIGSMATFIIKR